MADRGSPLRRATTPLIKRSRTCRDDVRDCSPGSGQLLLLVEPRPFLARPDGHVDVGALGAQRFYGRLLTRRARERVPAEEIAGVAPGDLVDVAVVGPGAA